MLDFAAFLDFYIICKESGDKTVQEIGEFLKLPDDKINIFANYITIFDGLIDFLHEYPDCDTSVVLKQTGIDVSDFEIYIIAAETLYPGLVKFKHLQPTDRVRQLLNSKQLKAVEFYAAADMADLQIAEKLNVSPEEIELAKKKLPIIKECNLEVKQFELEEAAREFFIIHPYSTVKDAAKYLKTTPQVLRTLLERLRVQGEDIKFNNVPARLEKEELRRSIIELKKEEPAITNSEISLRLSVPVSTIRDAINDTIKIYQSERADNYFFFLDKTSSDLESIKQEALARHSAGANTSSRWLEITLIAIEKQIAIHGLKAPDRLDIRQEIKMSKEDRDQIIEAAMATDAIDIDFKKIQVTGAQIEE